MRARAQAVQAARRAWAAPSKYSHSKHSQSEYSQSKYIARVGIARVGTAERGSHLGGEALRGDETELCREAQLEAHRVRHDTFLGGRRQRAEYPHVNAAAAAAAAACAAAAAAVSSGGGVGEDGEVVIQREHIP